MTDFLLALIALGAVTTVTLEVVLVVGLVRGLRRWMTRVERFRAQIAPLAAHAKGISRDVARSRSLVAGQAGRLAALATAIEPAMRYGLAGVLAARQAAGLLQGRRSKWALLAFVLRRLLR